MSKLTNKKSELLIHIILNCTVLFLPAFFFRPTSAYAVNWTFGVDQTTGGFAIRERVAAGTPTPPPKFIMDTNGAITSDIGGYGGFGGAVTNYVKYSSAEGTTGNWWQRSTDSGTSYTIDSGTASNGAKSFKVDQTSGTSAFGPNIASVSQNTSYTVSFWLKASTTLTAGVGWSIKRNDDSGSFTYCGGDSNFAAYRNITSAWQKYVFDCTTPTTLTPNPAQDAVLRFDFSGNGKQIWVDAVQIETRQQQGQSTNYNVATQFIPTGNGAITKPGGFTVSQDLTAYNNAYLAAYSGNVGIGTTAPGAFLDVRGTYSSATTGEQYGGRITTTYSIADTNLKQGLRIDVPITHTTGTQDNVIGLLSLPYKNAAGVVTNMFGLWTRIDNNASGAITNAYGLYIADSTETGTITNDYGIYQVDTGAVNYFGGNVGIGTTAPAFSLDVNGSAEIGTGTITYPTTPAGSGLTLSGSSLARLVMNDGTGNFNQYLNSYYDSSAVAYKYAVSAQAAGLFRSSAGTFGFYVAPSGTAGNTVTWTNAMYIDNSGNVGIGTTAPAAKLDVAGSILSKRVATANCNTTAPPFDIDWSQGNNQEVIIDGNCTFNFINGQDGGKYILIINDRDTATLTWDNTGVTTSWAGGAEPTWTSTSGKRDFVGFILAGTTYYGVAYMKSF